MKKYIRYILIMLIIVNCIIIFNFSSEQSNKSSQTSKKIIDSIIEINPKTKKLSFKEKEEIAEKITTPIRKTAHFSIYMSLGSLIYLCSSTFEIIDKKRILISLGLAFLYACTDEIHQFFVPGRSCELRDVFIDSCGALCGILLMCVIKNKLINNNKKI